MAYRFGISTNLTMVASSTGTQLSGTVWFVLLIIEIGIAFIPAKIAASKGRSFGGWLLFGLLCWLPALIGSLMVSDRRMAAGGAWGAGPASSWGSGASGSGASSWQSAPPPTTTPAGWYPDPGGGTQQRYWDGFRWTEHLR